jgi:Zn-dependent protease
MNSMIYQIAVFAIPMVLAIVLHEIAHGYVARMLGDRTAADLGRLTLNPIRHVDPVGTLLLPLMLGLAGGPIFGWAKPVPVVAERLNHPRRDMALVALAGPLTNLFLAALAAVAMRWWADPTGHLPEGGTAGFIADNLTSFLLINVFLAIFNLLPVPPFDGGHVVEAVLPRRLAAAYGRLRPFAFPVMLFLLVLLPTIAPGADIVARVVGPIARGIVRMFLAPIG